MLNYGFLMINFRKSPQNLPLNTDSFEHGFCMFFDFRLYSGCHVSCFSCHYYYPHRFELIYIIADIIADRNTKQKNSWETRKKLTYGHQKYKNRRKHYAPAWISVEMVGFEPMT